MKRIGSRTPASLVMAVAADAFVFAGILWYSPNTYVLVGSSLRPYCSIALLSIGVGSLLAILSISLAIYERRIVNVGLVIASIAATTFVFSHSFDHRERFWIDRFVRNQGAFHDGGIWFIQNPKVEISYLSDQPPNELKSLAIAGEIHNFTDIDGNRILVVPAYSDVMNHNFDYVFSSSGARPPLYDYWPGAVCRRLDANWYLIEFQPLIATGNSIN